MNGPALVDTSVVAALVVALGSAFGFAFSTSLQHQVAGSAPTWVESSMQLLRYVVRRPFWILGILTGGGSLVLHAVALKLGAIAVVQPVMVMGVVFAVLVRAALDRRRPSGREIGAVMVTAVGLACFLVLVNPGRSVGAPDKGFAAVLTVSGASLALAVASMARSGRSRSSRAVILGVSAGLLFGLTAGLLKLVVDELAVTGYGGALLYWPFWALIVVGPCGLIINQRAYRIAPLSLSMPILNVTDVIVAVIFGWMVLGEAPAHGSFSLAVQMGALVCTGLGLRLIACSVEMTEDRNASVV